MAVSLYTSRIVLEVLGVDDYGVYNVVGGLVGMFAILSGSLSAAISRFITFELGKGSKERLQTIFSTSVNVQLLLSFVIVLLLELAGIWFLNNKLQIAPERLDAAHVVLHVSMLTFVVNLISVPYNALIVAHERMSAFAYVSLLEVALKLGAIFLLKVIPYDKLELYAWSLFLIALSIRFVYGVYCKRHFAESRYRFVIDRPLLKEMFAFAGWNFIGTSSGVLKDQGLSIMLNIFFGTTVNAAKGISMQISSAVNSFVTNFVTAISPQITKSYAADNRAYMMQLIFASSRYGFFLLLLLSLPILIETKQILSLWLGVVPDYTVNFVRLILIDSLVTALSYSLITAMLATGQIKKYQIIVGGLHMLNLPFSYILLRLGFTAESTFIVAILLSISCLIARVYLLKTMIDLNPLYYTRQVLLKVTTVAVFSTLLPYLIYTQLSYSFSRLVIVSLVAVSSVCFFVYIIGINKQERCFINNKVAKFLSSKK